MSLLLSQLQVHVCVCGWCIQVSKYEMSTLQILSCGHVWFQVGLRSYKRHLAKDQNINNFSRPVGILHEHHGDDNDDGNNDVDDYIVYRE